MRIGIAPSLALVLAIFAVLASGLTGYYAYDTSRNLLVRQAEEGLLSSTQVLGQRFVVALDTAAKDANLLVSQARLPGKGNDAIADTARFLLLAHPEYFQVRLINAGNYGLEQVRLDRKGFQIAQVTGIHLQEQSHNLYVSQTLRLKPGQVYLSKIFINHEADDHSGFGRPTLIVAMPVTNPLGENKALVAINIDLETLFESMKSELPQDFKVYLTNEWGDFLMHPDASQTFGVEKGRRILVQDTFPSTASIVAGKVENVVVNTANIAQVVQTPSPRDVVAAFQKLLPTEFTGQHFFILGLTEPLDYVLQDIRALGANILRIVIIFSLLALLLAWLVSKAVTRPLGQILQAVHLLPEGIQGALLPVKRSDEIGLLARGVRDMQTQIRNQLADLESSRNAMQHLAHHDPLTGLPNRIILLDRLEATITQAGRTRSQFAVVFVDLDQFKEVNDLYGHQVGDLLLQAVAGRLLSGVRQSDTAARLAGDEFVVLLNPVRGAEDAQNVAEKLLQILRQPVVIKETSLPVHLSIGVSLFPENGSTAQAMIDAADQAMYSSKSSGHNTVSLAPLPT